MSMITEFVEVGDDVQGEAPSDLWVDFLIAKRKLTSVRKITNNRKGRVTNPEVAVECGIPQQRFNKWASDGDPQHLKEDEIQALRTWVESVITTGQL